MNSIIFDHVSKGFSLQHEKTFKEFLPQLFLGKASGKQHTVLKNLSFRIDKGETIGIIGKNGAGKSTIMKLIAGVTYPDKGEISISGGVAPLIELGAGFHGELTGYENIFLNAAILGLHKKEVEAKIDEIVAFSELGEYIYEPVKRYSSGMHMRLGFSIVIHMNSPILLVDEVLAVGDIEFQKKCLDRLQELKGKRTIIFVSHDEGAVTEFCERVLYLESGNIRFDGSPKEAFELYNA